MSYVANIILSFSIIERGRETETDVIYANMEKINAWLMAGNYGAFSVDLAAVAGGRKQLETPLFVAAFNYLPLDDFCKFIKSLEWEEPDCVQLFIKEQDRDTFMDRLLEEP